MRPYRSGPPVADPSVQSGYSSYAQSNHRFCYGDSYLSNIAQLCILGKG